MDSAANPYKSPETETQREVSELEQAATWNFRLGILALAVPTYLNAACLLAGPKSRAPLEIIIILGVWNAMWITGLAVLLWYAGMPLLKWIAGLFWTLLGSPGSHEAWLDATYAGFAILPLAGRIAALLWLLWLGLFFYTSYPGGPLLTLLFHVLGWTIGGWVLWTIGRHWRDAWLAAAPSAPVEPHP